MSLINFDGVDGVDFINVYSKGTTSIGKWLSNFTRINITIDDYEVKSIEGYWYFLLTNKKYLLSLSGSSAKINGMKEAQINDINDEFISKIKKAIDIKIKSNLLKFAEILEYDINIPLVHFYASQQDLSKKYPGHKWIIDHIEKRRFQLYKNNMKS